MEEKIFLSRKTEIKISEKKSVEYSLKTSGTEPWWVCHSLCLILSYVETIQ